MYCKNCGKTIEDNSTFCPYCGANQNAAPAGYYDQRKNIRQSELAEINNMIAYFSPKEEQYAEFDRLSRMLRQTEGRHHYVDHYPDVYDVRHLGYRREQFRLAGILLYRRPDCGASDACRHRRVYFQPPLLEEAERKERSRLGGAERRACQLL